MIASLLQANLKRELENLFADFRLNGMDDWRRVRVNVFEQFLPIPQMAEVDEYISDTALEEGTRNAHPEQPPFPYIIVRIEDGSIDRPGGAQTVRTSLIFGVIDRNPDNQGYKDILRMIQAIYHRFSVNPILAGKYECTHPIEWAMQEEESYPYFFGAMALSFKTVPIEREDKYT